VNRVRNLPDRDRLSVLTAVILLAFALTRFIDLPTRSITTTLLGSPLGIELNGRVMMLMLVAVLISAGSDTVIRSHPRLGTQPKSRTLVHWVLPGTTTLVLAAVLNRAPNGPLWWLGLALSAVALMLVLVAEYVAVDPTDPGFELASLGLTALAYTVALVLFALLRSVSTRAIIAAPIGGLVAAALTARLLNLRSALAAVAGGRVLLYATVVGLVAGETLWAVNYWRVSPSTAGLLAMIPFYLGVGLAQQHVNGRLSARVWVEYIVVGMLGLAIALAYALT
jgi:hypothetical protein